MATEPICVLGWWSSLVFGQMRWLRLSGCGYLPSRQMYPSSFLLSYLVPHTPYHCLRGTDIAVYPSFSHKPPASHRIPPVFLFRLAYQPAPLTSFGAIGGRQVSTLWWRNGFSSRQVTAHFRHTRHSSTGKLRSTLDSPSQIPTLHRFHSSEPLGPARIAGQGSKHPSNF
jgi:hypothetical protein